MKNLMKNFRELSYFELLETNGGYGGSSGGGGKGGSSKGYSGSSGGSSGKSGKKSGYNALTSGLSAPHFVTAREKGRMAAQGRVCYSTPTSGVPTSPSAYSGTSSGQGGDPYAKNNEYEKNYSNEELAKVANGISFPLGTEYNDEYHITSLFGPREPINTEKGKTSEYHSGIDISAKEGTRINSVSDGVVSEVGYSECLGNYIVVHHDNGTEKGCSTRYAHCGSISVSEGSSVSAGQQIATVGMTGKTTGPHLHLSYDGNGNGTYDDYNADNPSRILGY